EDPPVIEKSKPLNYSVNYHGNKFEITFDEYIKTQAISQEMVVSPPLEERPEVRLRGKTLVIEWFEDLRDSTTYTFSFGESIQDLNEGNIFLNLQFVFSTGGHLDSLSVLGTVLQAFNLQSHEEKVFLMLYSDMADSAPLKDIPDFVGQADLKGNFLINNVRPDTYRLFALQDLNRNYKYDVPEEFIGFIDSVIHLSSSLFEALPEDETGSEGRDDSLLISLKKDAEMGLRPDSSALADYYMLALAHGDSITLSAADSLVLGLYDTLEVSLADSSLVEEDDSITLADLAPWSIFVDVSLFQEENIQQYLVENTRKERLWFSMRFNGRVEDTVILEPYDFEPAGDWYIFEEHVMKDTFVYWITDSLVYKKDSLTMLVTYMASDSLLNMVPYYDTLKFNYREPAKKTTRTRKRDKVEVLEEVERISVSASPTSGREQDLFRPIPISIQHPVSTIDTSRIDLVKLVDSLEITVPYYIVHDAFKLRRYFLNVDWEG
ncbi:MAG: Ig-like domain-containing protein, partial [Bacteroidales bacterium]|nr:Ig-like domain-containing protein [Bacteroidales bacterium]